MTRSHFIAAVFALGLIVPFLALAPSAHAQAALNASCVPGVANACATGLTCDPNLDLCESGSQSSVTPTAGASGGSPTTLAGDTNPLDIVMSYIMELFAWLLGIAAITLDNAMYYTVVHMGSYVNALSAVGVAWRILRDIGNIVLIFGFVALGITVILDVNWYGGGTKMLPTLLIAAVFLNFSLFIAEAVIDTGNLFATEFYTQINNGQAAAPQTYSGTAISQNGISNAVMNQLGLQNIYSTTLSGQNIFKSGNVFLVGFMASLLFMIAAFVFFSLAFVLIARFIFLIFLIIVAPIGFAGLAVPKLEGTAKQWWGQLFEQTITAPVMLLMLYVALAVITDSAFLTGFSGSSATGSAASNAAATGWTAWLSGSGGLPGLASLLLSFIVAMGLLLAVTMLAKKMGAVGGEWATKMGGALSFGVVGFAGRRTVGRASNALSRTIRSTSFGRTDLGRLATIATDYGAKASFDARGSKTLAGGLKTLGTDAGAASKSNYRKIVDDSIRDRVNYAKTLEARGMTQEEKDSLAQATANTQYATGKRDEAKVKRDAVAQEKAKHEAEIAKLEAARKAVPTWNNDPMNILNLKNAQASLATSDVALTDANEKLADAEKGLATRQKEGETVSKKVNLAVSEQGAQIEYADSLEKVSSLSKPGTYLNAAGMGSVTAAAGAGAGALAGAGLLSGGVGAVGGFGAYLASAGPLANKGAAAKIKHEATKSESKKLADAVQKAFEDSSKAADKGGGGEEGKGGEAAH